MSGLRGQKDDARGSLAKHCFFVNPYACANQEGTKPFEVSGRMLGSFSQANKNQL
jgi:hypothetical protein